MPHSTDSTATANIVADTICRTVELGLLIDDAADARDITHLFCHPRHVNVTFPRCHEHRQLRDHVDRRLTDLPVAGHPHCCTSSNHGWSAAMMNVTCRYSGRQSLKLPTIESLWPGGCPAGFLRRMAVDNMSVKACAAALGIGWDKANDLALSARRDLAYGDAQAGPRAGLRCR